MSRFGGIDIGGTSIKYGLVINGQVKKKYEELTPQTEEALIILLKEIIRKLTLEKVAGIGIGFPGYIDQIKKRYIWGPNLKFKVNLGELVEQVNHNKLKIDNDGNLGALGEYENYYKGKVDNLIYVSFGTGIGGGIISASKLIRGEGSAGEIGHILISNDNNLDPCSCGKIGCFESLASASRWTDVVRKLIKEEPLSDLSILSKKEIKGSSLFDSQISLTKFQKIERDKIVEYICRGFISLYEVFDNKLFIIGGAFSEEDNDLILLLKSKIQELDIHGIRSFPDIKMARLKSDAGIVGAAYLADD